MAVKIITLCVLAAFVDLTTEGPKSLHEEKYWIKELQLNEDDRQCILPNQWLNDKIINVAQKLLKRSHPEVNGLQKTYLGETLTYTIERGKFVQILHINGNHWITISNVFSQRNEIISVYDSFSSIDLPVKAKEQIAALICCPDKYFLLEFQSVSKQRGGSDCGLFSIAFATAICFKINPVAVDFKQEDLRGHLFMCLEDRKMVPFPSRKKKIENCLSKVKISVYCECRQIEIGRMIMCDGCQEWYHQGCVYIPKNAKKIKWYCHRCKI